MKSLFKKFEFPIHDDNSTSTPEATRTSSLLLVILFFLGIGLVQVYSTSFIFATERFDDGLYFFKKQLFFTVIALFALIFFSRISFKVIERWGWLLWLIGGAGVILTFVPGLGVRVGGAARWLQLPFGFRFEPSEILKYSTGFMVASMFAMHRTSLRKLKWPWLLGLVAAPIALLLKQPDFGSFAIICTVFLSLLFCFGLKWKYFISLVLVAGMGFGVLIMTKGYRSARIQAFLDPWADPDQKGFQMIQSMLTFHSGGLLGEGLGQGQGKLYFLPEAHTDFTLAVLAEENGFVGFLFIMGLYFFILLRGFQLSLQTEDRFKQTVLLGVILTFAMNVFINAGVVTGLLPPKGLTLPFLSYGGSSLVTLCIMFGIILNLEREIKSV